MKRRYISDEGYAVLMVAIGIGALISVLVFGINDPLGMIAKIALFFISIGGWLLSIVEDRKRRGLDVPPDADSPAPPAGVTKVNGA